MKIQYMMATKAMHISGDISRKSPDICRIYGETDHNYIGNWVFGFGFINVEFPKNTTRELTPDEINKYHGNAIMLNNTFMGFLILKDEPLKEVFVQKAGTNISYIGNTFPPTVGKPLIVMGNDYDSPLITSTVQKIEGNKVYTQNSEYIIKYI